MNMKGKRSASKPELALTDATATVDDLWQALPQHMRKSLAKHVETLSDGETARKDATSSIYRTVLERVRVLAVLMIFQSFSGFIIDRYSDFIREHIFVTLYLTMLVGAGGNAGNQSAVFVIRSLATGTVSRSDVRRVVCREAALSLLEGALLTMVGFWRVYLWQRDLRSTVAVCVSLFAITSISVVVGCLLPFAFDRFGMDPAHAGPAIQVVMDVMGVSITCAVCSLIAGDMAVAVTSPPPAPHLVPKRLRGEY